MINTDQKDRSDEYRNELRRIEMRDVYTEGFSRGVVVGILILLLLLAAGWLSRHDEDHQGAPEATPGPAVAHKAIYQVGYSGVGAENVL